MYDPAVHDHGHDHAGGRAGDRRALTIALCLALGYMGAEVVGGLWTGSLALLADAGHMFSDAAALTLSLFALWVAQRPASARRTYGYYRAEILAALVHGAGLVLVALLVAREALERLGEPQPVMGLPMLLIATGGLAVNAAALVILNRGRGASLNVRGAWLHVLSDALGSGAAIIAGALVWGFGWHAADPLASLAISVLIVISAWKLLAEATDVLLEGAPRHIDVDRVRDAIVEVPGVLAVHDLHVWTITSGMVALSCHVVAKDPSHAGALLTSVGATLEERFGIGHTTIQVEPEGFEESETCD